MRQVEAFKAVVEAGGVSAAAKRLLISQPAVSKLIMAFERSIDLALFLRHKRRLVPTPEALLLYEEIERFSLGINRLDRFAADLRALKRGSIRVACLPSLGLRIVPRLMARFAAERPGARLTIHVRTSAKISDWLLGQQIDLGIAMLPVHHPAIDVEPLVRARAVCVLPSGHPLASSPRLTPPDLKDESFISLGHEDRSEFTIQRVFDDYSVTRHIAFETNLSEVACHLVASGAGVSIVDPFTAAHFDSPDIVIRPFHPMITFDIFLLFPALRPRSRLLESFITELKAEIGDGPAPEARHPPGLGSIA